MIDNQCAQNRNRTCTPFRKPDFEFTLVKVKGKPEDFINVHIYTNSEMPYLNFAYNELGEWKLGNHAFKTIYQSGKAEIAPGTNVVRVEYRYKKLRYFINGKKVADIEFKEQEDIYWKDMNIEALVMQKTVIAIDKMVLKAYADDIPFSDDAKKLAEEAAIPKYREVPEHLKYLKFIKFEENGKWGLMNNQGLVLAPAKYDQLGEMSEEYDPIEGGFARVGLNGYYTFIDSNGKELTKLIYEDAYYQFSEGLVGVMSLGKWGFINTKGETVIYPDYTFVGPFSDGLAVVSKSPDGGGYNFPNKGAIDKTGKLIIPLKYKELQDFSEGLAAFYTSDNSNFGFIDKTDKIVIPQRYDFTTGFAFGYATVSLPDSANSDGLIDKTGKTLIRHAYKSLIVLGSNLVYAQTQEKENKQTWLTDVTGKAISKKYTDIFIPFNEGGLVGVVLGNKQGFIDKTGKEIIPVIYDKPEYGGNVYFNRENTVELNLNGQIVKFDNKGNQLK
ncbi:MAG: WG repeat-containing protein [Chitinophagales bacterium]|nr:WG repeat-containing protein [Chitinophagales bacterium]